MMAEKSLCLPLQENGSIFVDIHFHSGRKCPSRRNTGNGVQKLERSDLLALAHRILTLVGSAATVDERDMNTGEAPKRPTGRQVHALGNRTKEATAVQPKNGERQVLIKTYNGISVYEMDINGTRVMKRCSDSWMNASHILTLAGRSKIDRLKLLAKEVHHLEHEKTQGGYAQYQGTWITPNDAQALCRKHQVEDVLRPLLESGTNDVEGNRISVGPTYTFPAESRPRSSTTEQMIAAHRFEPRGDLDLVNGPANHKHHGEQRLLPEIPSADGIREGQFHRSCQKATSEGIRLPVQVFDLVPTTGPIRKADFPFEAEFIGTDTEAVVYESLSSSALAGIDALPTSNHQQHLQNARLHVYIHIQGSASREIHGNGTDILLSLLPQKLDRNKVSLIVQLS